MGLLSRFPFWVQFSFLYIPFLIFIFAFAPSLKWKLLFSVAGAAGIVVALSGATLPSVSGSIRRKN